MKFKQSFFELLKPLSMSNLGLSILKMAVSGGDKFLFLLSTLVAYENFMNYCQKNWTIPTDLDLEYLGTSS